MLPSEPNLTADPSLLKPPGLEDSGNPWRPRHLSEVVGVRLVIKNWLRKNAQKLSELEEARLQLNTSLVFEPLAVTISRLNNSRNSSARHSLRNSIAPSIGEGEQSTTETVVPSEVVTNSIPLPPIRNGSAQNLKPPTGNNTQQNAITVDRESQTTPRRPINQLKSLGQRFWATLSDCVDPSHSFYYYWTFVIYIGFLYNSFMSVVFVFDDTQTDEFFRLWLTLNIVFDLFNLMDIFVNTRVGFMEDGMLVKSGRRLLKRYLHSWHFLLDLVAIFPTDFFLLANRGISLLRVNRLLKCYRVWDFVEKTNVRTNYPNGFRILNIVVVCLVLFHWNAALYFKISLLHGIFTSNPAAWEFNYVKNQDAIFASCGQYLPTEADNDEERQCLFNETGREFDDPDDRMAYVDEMMGFWGDKSEKVPFSNFSKQYSLSFYWSSLTLTTRGQQPWPTAVSHNLLEIFDTIVGILVFAVIVGSVGNVITMMNRQTDEFQQLTDGIKFYMNYRNVSTVIQKRVIDCVAYIQKHAMIQNEALIMDSVPPRLRGELAVQLHMDSLRRVELFADCEPNLLYELVLRLKMQMFAPGDLICRCGDLAKEMFLSKRGLLEVLDVDGTVVAQLPEGSTFGELSILRMERYGLVNQLEQTSAHTRRTQSLRSVGYSEVYFLRQEDVTKVLADYPDQRNLLVEKAFEIMRKRGEISSDYAHRVQAVRPRNRQTFGSEGVGEVLQSLVECVEDMDSQLDELYDSFKEESSKLKKRVTTLEEIYLRNRKAIANHLQQKPKKQRNKPPRIAIGNED